MTINKSLPKRTTRGKRSTQLLGEAKEADEQFWNQSAFGDDESDEEFSESSPDTDTSDSDIDEPEPGDEDEKIRERDALANARAEKIASAFTGSSAKTGYLDPAKQKKSAAALKRQVEREKQRLQSSLHGPTEEISASTEDKEGASTTDQTTGRTLRRSTQTKRQRIEEATANNAEVQTKERISTTEIPPATQLTQEEILFEAADTTIENLRVLNSLQRREEEDKLRKLATKKKPYPDNAPRIIFSSSRTSGNLLKFTNVDEAPAIINHGPIEYPIHKTSVVSDQKAHYRDPGTYLPYASKEEFATIQEQTKLGKIPIPYNALQKQELKTEKQELRHTQQLIHWLRRQQYLSTSRPRWLTYR